MVNHAAVDTCKQAWGNRRIIFFGSCGSFGLYFPLKHGHAAILVDTMQHAEAPHKKMLSWRRFSLTIHRENRVAVPVAPEARHMSTSITRTNLLCVEWYTNDVTSKPDAKTMRGKCTSARKSVATGATKESEVHTKMWLPQRGPRGPAGLHAQLDSKNRSSNTLKVRSGQERTRGAAAAENLPGEMAAVAATGGVTSMASATYSCRTSAATRFLFLLLLCCYSNTRNSYCSSRNSYSCRNSYMLCCIIIGQVLVVQPLILYGYSAGLPPKCSKLRRSHRNATTTS